MANTIPTKSNLMALQKSLKLAKLGYELMDRKKNILIKELLSLSSNAKELRKEANDAYAKAYKNLLEASLTLGDISPFVSFTPIDDGINLSVRSVMGVELPEIHAKKSRTYPYFGFSGTGPCLDRAYIGFERAKELTAKLAAAESDVCRLADAVRKTQKRANALSNVQIPALTEQIKTISEALDEKEREDFSRMKVIKRQKEKS